MFAECNGRMLYDCSREGRRKGLEPFKGLGSELYDHGRLFDN
jgi:hypothetical protein